MRKMREERLSRLFKAFGLPLALTLIGVVLSVVSLLALTVMRPDNHVTAVDGGGSEPYVMTHEGVLALQQPPVTVTAQSADGGEVTLALGKSADVMAWLDGSAYREISGLQSWTQLKTTAHAAPEKPAKPGPLGDSDMWTQVKKGTGKVTLELTKADADTSLIAASDGKGAAPKITISWTQKVSLAWALVLGGIGILLMLVGISLWYQVRRRRARKATHATSVPRPTPRLEEDEPQTLTTTVGDRTVTLPSRRAMREARARGEASITVGGQRFDTGLIPVVEKVREVEEPKLQTTPATEDTGAEPREAEREETVLEPVSERASEDGAEEAEVQARPRPQESQVDSDAR